MMRPIIIWGATGQARVLAEFLPKLGFELRAFFDNNPKVLSPIPAVPIHYGRDGFLHWREANPSPAAGLAAIGGEHGEDRLAMQDFLSAHGIEIATAVHPRAFVAGDASIGAGSQVLAMAVVAAGCALGRGCIVNHHADVDHECILADGVHLGPGATLCGLVSVGAFTLVGAGATVLPRIRIGSRSVVGAGSVVTRDIPDNVIVLGNPARIIRAHDNRPAEA
jgi:sugar O-acyltransferase (sialic acid O-acetyltransferase NeuD family)